MKSYTQILPRSAKKSTLAQTTVFPPNEDGNTAVSWNERPDGRGVKYESGQADVSVGDGKVLYARYPSKVCTLNYFYTDGHRESVKIQENYTLRNPLKEKPIYPEFQCWNVNGVDRFPSSVYPWYPTEEVKTDVDAFMASQMTCTMQYDSNGGTGTMASQKEPCQKHVDPASREVVADAQSVVLKVSEFSKEGAQFGGWKLDGEVKQPGDEVMLDTDKIAFVRWLYSTAYNVTARAYPSNVANVTCTQDASQPSHFTLEVKSVSPGYSFAKWTDSSGVEIGSAYADVYLPEHSPAEIQPTVDEVFTAHFQTDVRYTQVIGTDGSAENKLVIGKLTRSMLEGAMAASAPKSKFAIARGVK